MATVQQIEDAIRKAAAKGDKALVLQLAKARDAALSGGQTAAPAQPTTPPPYDPNTTFGAIRQGSDDAQRVLVDSITRGFMDKGLDATIGGGQQEQTRQSRERLPGYVEAPLDITGAVISSPYRVGSAVGGGLWGAAEGAANAYGHQEGWMPEWGNIAKEAGKGAVLGSGAAKVGEWLGKGYNRVFGEAPSGPQTSDELFDAAASADKRTRVGKNTVAGSERMKAAELANAGGKDEFKKFVEGMDRKKWPHNEQVQATKIANKSNKRSKLLSGLGSVVSGGNFWGAIPIAKATAGAGPMLGAALKTAAHMVDDINPKDFKVLQEMILDSSGRMKTDQKSIDAARDYLSKIATQWGQSN